MTNTRDLIKTLQKYSDLNDIIATNALHYIFDNEGTINNFLENYDLSEEFYDDDEMFYMYYGFNMFGEPRNE